MIDPVVKVPYIQGATYPAPSTDGVRRAVLFRAAGQRASLVVDRSPPGAASQIRLSPGKWRQLAAVNRAVNRAIFPVNDSKHYGRAEYWTIPNDGLGDCEDYALTKRAKLIALGYPQPALRMADRLD